MTETNEQPLNYAPAKKRKKLSRKSKLLVGLALLVGTNDSVCRAILPQPLENISITWKYRHSYMNNTINNRLSFRIGDVITGTATIKTNRDGTKDLCSLNGFCNSQGLEAVKYHKIFKPLE